MSNRTLLEFNHDYTGKINERPTDFVSALLAYLRTGDKDFSNLESFGVTVLGMRHHSEEFALTYTIQPAKRETRKPRT